MVQMLLLRPFHRRMHHIDDIRYNIKESYFNQLLEDKVVKGGLSHDTNWCH